MKRSIWTRDLLDNRFGRILKYYVLPAVLLVLGTVDTVTRKARWKHYDYRGFDAVCIGLGIICISGVMIACYHLPVRSLKEAKRRTMIILGLGTGFIACFATALFRNI